MTHSQENKCCNLDLSRWGVKTVDGFIRCPDCKNTYSQGHCHDCENCGYERPMTEGEAEIASLLDEAFADEKPEETTTGWEGVRLHECKECMSKSGSPVLCVSCQDNRTSIEILKDCIRNIKKEFADELREKIEDLEECMLCDNLDEVLALLPEQESNK